jgi:hypothetical protein
MKILVGLVLMGAALRVAQRWGGLAAPLVANADFLWLADGRPVCDACLLAMAVAGTLEIGWPRESTPHRARLARAAAAALSLPLQLLLCTAISVYTFGK